MCPERFSKKKNVGDTSDRKFPGTMLFELIYTVFRKAITKNKEPCTKHALLTFWFTVILNKLIHLSLTSLYLYLQLKITDYADQYTRNKLENATSK